MHDPMTVAFEIKYPWCKRNNGPMLGGKPYRETFITIWHKDPEKRTGHVCRRSDDTCGWSGPNPTVEEYDEIKKIAYSEYSNIFERQVREREGASYADVCNAPTVYDAAYWCWRRIKNHLRKDDIWMYGKELKLGEVFVIIQLTTNPVDNVKSVFERVNDQETFKDFFMCIYRNYKRYHRPWYKHPRWHVHHWRIQLHPWQQFYRRFFQKCCKCGKRGFPKGVYAMGDWSGTRTWHSTCDEAQTQGKQK